jgi:hypothetical protein
MRLQVLLGLLATAIHGTRMRQVFPRTFLTVNHAGKSVPVPYLVSLEKPLGEHFEKL